MAAVSRGEFAISGFRNRDLQAIFFPSPAKDAREARRRSAWITRKLRLLRAHRLLTKIAGTPPLSANPIRPQSHRRSRYCTSMHHRPAHSSRRMKIFASGEESMG